MSVKRMKFDSSRAFVEAGPSKRTGTSRKTHRPVAGAPRAGRGQVARLFCLLQIRSHRRRDHRRYPVKEEKEARHPALVPTARDRTERLTLSKRHVRRRLCRALVRHVGIEKHPHHGRSRPRDLPGCAGALSGGSEGQLWGCVVAWRRGGWRKQRVSMAWVESNPLVCVVRGVGRAHMSGTS